MIQVENLVKTFQLNKKQRKENNTDRKSHTAVDDVSFSCQPGSVFSLLGPNGAGKTTTLRMIATIIQPTSGTIKVAGIDAKENPTAIREKIGFLTGSTELYARLTADETINYFAKLYHVPPNVLKQRKVEPFYLSSTLASKLINGNQLVFVSPDAGGTERARSYAKRFDAEIALIDKRRPEPGASQVMHVVGEVEGRECLIVDDIVG